MNKCERPYANEHKLSNFRQKLHTKWIWTHKKLTVANVPIVRNHEIRYFFWWNSFFAILFTLLFVFGRFVWSMFGLNEFRPLCDGIDLSNYAKNIDTSTHLARQMEYFIEITFVRRFKSKCEIVTQNFVFCTGAWRNTEKNVKYRHS